MTLLIAGLLLFFAAHVVSIANESWRNRMVARLGVGPWKGLYSVVSIAGFILIIKGYGMARGAPIVLYDPPAWLAHIALLLMVPAFIFALAAYFPGRIRATVKHPLLAATKTWAIAHLLANGTAADVLLFGSFLAWAIADWRSYRHRTQRFYARAPERNYNDAIAVAGGLALYALFVLWAHEAWIGVSPIRSMTG